MKHNGITTHIPQTHRPGGRRSIKVAATERSQADSSNANESDGGTQPSASRDLTVAATGDGRRAGARGSTRTRIGKIARLPKEVREELNRRLQDGEPGEQLLDWLNALPKVRKILAAQFGGRPITKQNLCEWRQGGYRDWERVEEDRLCVERLTERAASLTASADPDESDDGPPFSERLAAVLLVELARALEELKDERLPATERLQLVRQMHREVTQSRREDNRAAKLRIEQERWEWESERFEIEQHEREMKEMKDKLSAPYEAAMKLHPMTEIFGGGKLGRKMAARMLELQYNLDPGTLGGDEPSRPVKPGPTKSGSRRRRPSATPAPAPPTSDASNKSHCKADEE